MRELGIDSIYLDFYSAAYITDDINNPGKKIKKYKGFYPCSVDTSRAWAIDSGFMKHRCIRKAHRGLNHCELVMDSNVATWRCPETGTESVSPHRHKDYVNRIPQDFVEDTDILKMARKARTWYWELSLLDNQYRDVSYFPKKMTSMDDYDRQWDRVIWHPFMLEIDATKEDNRGRRDLLSKRVYLEEANLFIYTINEHLINSMGIAGDRFEWWFSGNGLYCILNPYLNSYFVKPNGESNSDYFKKNLAFWNNHVDKLAESTELKRIKYVNIDNKEQHMRSYIKTPFSLHQDYDRPCLPLTCMFGGNGRIDLTSSLFMRMVDPRNLTKELISRYFLKEVDGIVINDFLKVFDF